MATPTADQLNFVPLLAGLSDQDRAALAARFEVDEFPPGKDIVTEGRTGYAFYVVAEGQVQIAQDGVPLRVLGPGEHFGEIAILGEGRRTATATAVTRVSTWTLFGTEFRSMQIGQPAVAARLVQAMQDRLTSS